MSSSHPLPPPTSSTSDSISLTKKESLSNSEGLTESDIKVPDLILQFTKMNVAPSQTAAAAPKSDTTAKKSSTATKVAQSATFLLVKKHRFKAKSSEKVILRPSKLSLTLAKKYHQQRRDGDSLFREFSEACAKELDSIVRLTPSSDLTSGPRSTKFRQRKKKTKSESAADELADMEHQVPIL